MLLDNRTLVFSLMLVGAMMALSLAVVSWGREHDSLKKWAGAMALEAVAFFLIGARGAIPDVVSIMFPIILMVTAQALKLAAIYEYRELPWPRWQCLVPVGLVSMVIVLLPLDDFRGRLIYGSLIYATQMLMILKILHTDMDSRAGRAWWLLFGATTAILLFALLRGIVAFFRIIEFATIESTVTPSPVQIAVFIGLMAMSMLGSLGFILMVKERADRTIRSLAMTDSLTGVINRHAFMEQAEKEHALARRHMMPLALLMIDIDYFKRINDEFGHPVGDDVLVDVVRILGSRLRKQDTLGRYGGEEFCILLPGTDEVGAMVVAETLRGAVAEAPLAVGYKEVFATVSIGVTVCPSSCDSCDQEFDKLLADADAALYQAKNEGRNRVVSLSMNCQSANPGSEGSEENATYLTSKLLI
ncbi:GGDEF domain-containing protein [Sedimenticola hydrogenitrophicus]|uniref:GGDEF domain-containing protein n=1 Tax=Sedimenticola hydrogenitrophicus TaxID=2967975 RepID=UPI0021A3B52B|nr:GGDEF domain-containing protein [Sedimenticola hydrogenitrophicus]